MKTTAVVICLGSLCILGGCANVEGVDMYHLRGRLVNAQDGKPMAGARVVGAIFLGYDPPAECWKREFSITDGQGDFDAPVGKLVGGPYPLFLIPVSRTPETLGQVAVYIGVEGHWQKRIVAVGKPQQSKMTATDRWVELGELRYDPNAPTVTTRPAGT